MGLNLDASPEELKIFLEEVEEHLQTIEEDLVKLEKEDDNPDLLQEIFRASHTLKGSSATIGHHRMANLTHAMENILDKLRKNQLTVSSGLIDVLFEALDHLRVLKDEIINDEESDINLDEILQKLANAAQGEMAAGAGEEQAPSGVNKAGVKLSFEEQDIVQKGIEEGRHAYTIHLHLDVEQEMLAVRSFVTLMSLNEWCEVIASRPSQDEIEKEQVTSDLDVVVLSAEEAVRLKELVGALPNISALEVDAYTDDLTGGKRGGVSPEPALPEVQQERTVAVSAPQEISNPVKREKPVSAGPNAAVKKNNRTVRVDVDLLDSLMNLVGELVIDRTRLFQILGHVELMDELDEISQELGRTSIHIGRVTTQLQEQIMKARMLPVESLFNKFPRLVRDLSNKAGKQVNFIMTGQETELDRSIIEEIGDPLIHILRNALDHGIESPEERTAAGKDPVGQLKLAASHEENHIIITITDDGRGINADTVKQSAVKKGILTEDQVKRLSDKEAVNLIFASGLSTAKKVTDVSGRGVGMDVVRTNIEKINGTVEINTVIGRGSEFKIKLPLTLAIIRALLVSIDNYVYAIPLSSVTETIRMRRSQIEYVNNREVIVVRGKVLPLARLDNIFGLNRREAEAREKLFVVVVNLAGQQIGIVVDSLVGEQEIVIKSLGKYIGDVQGISGATILGDGNVALIVDVSNLVKKAAS
jgi:two-component system chemotaxis sensor kinase CheA